MKHMTPGEDSEINIQNEFIFWKTGFVGISLILTGLFFLLINFSIIPVSGELHNRVLGILFFIMGIIFAFFQGGGGGLFWFIIPGGVSFTIGIITVIVGLDRLFTLFAFSIFCLGLAVTFLLVFLLRKREWWALLPAGALLGVSAWIWLAQAQPIIGYHPVALLFCTGNAFFAVYFFSVQRVKMRFALFTGMLVVAVSVFYYVILLFNEMTLLWPILLVIAGGLFPVAVGLIEKRIKKNDGY
ncbi:MAG TPA: hypothetical protein ENN69_02170 [Spirochaetia bacterium]|nr:hypothetical protein [Spirochaetia bacterium]